MTGTEPWACLPDVTADHRHTYLAHLARTCTEDAGGTEDITTAQRSAAVQLCNSRSVLTEQMRNPEPISNHNSAQ